MHVCDLLARMIGFDSVNSSLSGKKEPEKQLSAFLASVASDAGLETKTIPVDGQADDLLILFERDPAFPWILFDSHLDTVSATGMSVDPFAAEKKDGRIYGRGASDTKGSGAAMLTALLAYASEGAGGNNVMLLFSVDEEWGMSGIRAFIDSYYRPGPVRVQGAVVGEPTRLVPVIAHNGVQRYSLSTLGVAAHSSNPSLGRSAISSMARVVSFLETEHIPTITATHPLTGTAQCSINVIRGGTAANIIPDRCEIQIDRRTVPGEIPSEVVRRLETSLEEYRRRFPQDEIELKAFVDTPPLTPAEDRTFLESVRRAISRTGRNPSPTGVQYATHAGDLCNAGIACVVFGPGDIAQGHTKDEWIDEAELEASVGIYFDIMRGV